MAKKMKSAVKAVGKAMKLPAMHRPEMAKKVGKMLGKTKKVANSSY